MPVADQEPHREVVAGEGQESALSSLDARRFGDRLRAFRNRQGISQRRLAQLLGVNESTISRIEGGSRRPPRSAEFYNRLRALPGLGNDEFEGLLRSSGVPYWPSGDRLRDESAWAVAVAARDGLVVEVRLHAGGSVRSDEDREQLLEMLRTDVQLCLRDYRRELARAEERRWGDRAPVDAVPPTVAGMRLGGTGQGLDGPFLHGRHASTPDGSTPHAGLE
jgi:transcriptional regulator with XRE-family HTH domain